FPGRSVDAAQEQLEPPELLRRGGDELAGADSPGRVDLAPAVRRVVDPRPDDAHARPDARDRDAPPVGRHDLDEQVAADPAVPAREEALLARVEAELDVDVAVVGFEPHDVDGPGRDAAADLPAE